MVKRTFHSRIRSNLTEEDREIQNMRDMLKLCPMEIQLTEGEMKWLWC